MNFDRYVSIVFIVLIAISSFSIGCDDMQMLDVMDGGPMLPDGYLSLTSEDEDAITPTNESYQWGTYDLRWEKIKGGEIPGKPDYAQDWDFDAFEHWIYLQAASRLVFDFGERYFSRFECSVLLPNLCDDTASIEMKWLANNVEIYNSGVINTEEIVGIAFDIPPRTKILTLEVTDAGDDNICDHFIIGNSRLTQIPSDLLPPQPDLMLTEAYLSLSSQATDAMTAINDSEEWVGAGGTWEKFKGEETPPRPDDTVAWNTETFEHWFFSHAESKIVFDLKGQNFTYFECNSRLPNSCGGVASVEFIWFADDVEVYNSGVINSPLGTEMAFDIPAGTKTLTLQVTDGGDDISCDQYVIGNPRLYAEKSEEAVSREMYRALPEISMTAELEPGKYRMIPNHVDRGNFKIREFYKTIGDTKTDETEVRIELTRQPWDKTADGDLVISRDFGYDEIVVEITQKLEVREEPKGRFTKTIHLYEGIALLNLTNPHHLFEYEALVPREAEPYLAIISETGEAILPSNPHTEWVGWGDSTWGNIKNGVLPPKPQSLLDNPPVETFEHWFYSHAECRFVYELGAHNYTYFESSVVLASVGSIEIIWFADDVEVYNSGVINRSSGVQQIGFDIPTGTQTLTLQVTDGGDGINHDHFVIGNPRLLLERPQVSPHVSITPTEIRNPTVGTQFVVNIDITDGVDVQSYNLNVNFDSTALKYVSSANGDFLRGAFPLGPIVSEDSIQLIAALGSGVSNGDGTLVTVTFEVLSAKSSDITLGDVTITNDAGDQLAATTAGAKVVVQ